MKNLEKLFNKLEMTKKASIKKQASDEDAVNAVNSYMNKIASTNSSDLVTSGIIGVSNYVSYQNNNNQ